MKKIYIKCPYCDGKGGYRVFPKGDLKSKWIRCIMCNSGRCSYPVDDDIKE